ncbi:hypothetical protein QQP08_025043 [Theobroma cacao]|uniref:Uncharacterized protein n=1 Tax=Theobroma cacao TaxID=3641 RepID=A0A061GPY7_THECC|nr:Uncharacterized protein TCM_039297 [Theobroma cacao]WRX32556.1 hypothetical protein QQP08_025043 [Theobroma cacao]
MSSSSWSFGNGGFNQNLPAPLSIMQIPCVLCDEVLYGFDALVDHYVSHMLAYEGLPINIHHNGRNCPLIPLVQNFILPPLRLIPSSVQLRNYLLAQNWAYLRNYALRYRQTSQSRVRALENHAPHAVPLAALVRIGSSSTIGPQRWLSNPTMEILQRENQLPTFLFQQRRYHNLRRRNLNQREENQILANGVMLAPPTQQRDNRDPTDDIVIVPPAQQRDNRNGNLTDGIVLTHPAQQRDNRNLIDGIMLSHLAQQKDN